MRSTWLGLVFLAFGSVACNDSDFAGSGGGGDKPAVRAEGRTPGKPPASSGK